jgi:hypothetical protein
LSRNSHALPPEIEQALARATREERLVALVAQAAAKNWRVAAWLLERRFPERWGPERLRARDVAPTPSTTSEIDDLFAEVDELAARRRREPRDGLVRR